MRVFDKADKNRLGAVLQASLVEALEDELQRAIRPESRNELSSISDYVKERHKFVYRRGEFEEIVQRRQVSSLLDRLRISAEASPQTIRSPIPPLPPPTKAMAHSMRSSLQVKQISVSPPGSPRTVHEEVSPIKHSLTRGSMIIVDPPTNVPAVLTPNNKGDIPPISVLSRVDPGHDEGIPGPMLTEVVDMQVVHKTHKIMVRDNPAEKRNDDDLTPPEKCGDTPSVPDMDYKWMLAQAKQRGLA